MKGFCLTASFQNSAACNVNTARPLAKAQDEIVISARNTEFTVLITCIQRTHSNELKSVNGLTSVLL